GQHQNAVNDLNRVLLNKPKDVPTLLLRAECREANLDLENAKKDLEAAQKAMEGDPAFTTEDRRALTERKEKLAALIFEQNRESDPPNITVVEPFRKTGSDVVQVSAA